MPGLRPKEAESEIGAFDALDEMMVARFAVEPYRNKPIAGTKDWELRRRRAFGM